MFCKKRCSSKFHKFHRKTSVLKSLFNRPVTLLKIDSYFEEHLRTINAENIKLYILEVQVALTNKIDIVKNLPEFKGD